MEAGGIEPPSRNGPNGGLYMLSPVFCLRPDDDHEQPSPGSGRLFLAAAPPAGCGDQPPVFGSRGGGTTRNLGYLFLGSQNRGGGEADPACDSDMVVVGSCCLPTCFTRPSGRPRHATTTAVVRSKPIAPDDASRS